MSRALSIAFTLAAFSATAPALAADEAPGSTVNDSGDIVVTAQLRQQNAVDVPIALTAYSGAFLEKLGIQEFDRLGDFVPGFEVQNQSPNNPGFVIRGITSDSGTAFNEPRVSVFQDGVSISKSRGSYVELFDLDRVEIAKGPQSTLYGRGALIGAVNIVEAKADPSGVDAYMHFSLGNYRAIEGEAMVNEPLGDKAAIRIAGRYKVRDGYVGNLLGVDDFASTKTGAVRASFHADPTETFSFDVIGNYQHDAPSGTPFKSIAFSPTDPATGAVIGDRGRNSAAALAAASDFPDGNQLGVNRDVYGVTGLAKWRIGDHLTLNSITGWRRFKALEVFDADGTSLPILTAAEDARGKQFSQELRLTYESERLTAFVGASYFHESGSERTPAEFDERETLARLAGALNGGGAIPGRPLTDPAPSFLFANPAFTGALLQGAAAASGVALSAPLAQAIAANLQPGHIETSTNFARTNSVDVFGDATFHITDKFEIGGGLRYSHDDKTSRITAAVLNGRSILGGFIGALSQPAPVRTALLQALAVPGAANIPPSALFPVPLFGLGLQPTANNGDLISASHDSGGFAFRGTARYAPTPDTSLYLTYARGRRPQVISAGAPSAPFAAPNFAVLPTEKVDSYEGGAKASLLNHTLYVDGAVFYYRYKNFQTVVQQGVQLVDSNAGRAESYGFEGQLNWAPVDWVRIFATYAYNHSRFKSGAYDGNHFRLSPDHSGSFGVTFTSPAANGGQFDLTPTVTAQSKEFFDDNNDLPALQQPPAALVADNIQDEVQKGYALVGLRGGFTTADGRLRIEGFVDNLLNKKYIKDAGNTGDALGLPTFIAGNPRFFGGSVSYKFRGK
jgi:iron complex outermembrane recepter protein